MLPNPTQSSSYEALQEDVLRISSLLDYAMEARVSNVQKSIDYAKQARDLSSQIGYETGMADSLNALGLFYMIVGHNEKANRCATEALSIYRKSDDMSGMANSLYTLGSVQYKESRHHLGFEKLFESLKLHRKVGDLVGQSRTLKAIGFIYETFHEDDKALETYLECRKISHQIGDKNGESNACNPLSGLYLERGDIERATETINVSIQLKKQTGDKRGLAFALYGKGKIHLKQGDNDLALEMFTRSLKKHQQVGEQLGTAMCHIKLAALLLRLGALQQCKDHLYDALSVGEAMENQQILYKVYFQLYKVADQEGDKAKALDYHVAYHNQMSTVVNTGTTSKIKSLEAMWKMESLEIEAEAQRERNEIVQRKNEELDKFVSRVSHDLKGPISSMLSLHEIVKKEIEDTAALNYFEMYHNRLQRLNHTIADLLDLSKVNSLDILRTEIDFSTLINDCLDSYKFYPYFARIDFSIQIEKNLSFHSDRRLIIAIVQNLIENSIKYCDPKRDVSTVSVDIRLAAEDYLGIVVEDNGIGIDPRYQSKIFDMFYRANDEIPGSGLGMYILKNAVDKLDGEVKLTSNVGVGSKFLVLLPIIL